MMPYTLKLYASYCEGREPVLTLQLTDRPSSRFVIHKGILYEMNRNNNPEGPTFKFFARNVMVIA